MVKSILPRILLLAASLSLMALLGELVLRAIVGQPVIWLYPQEYYADDRQLGYHLAPNQDAFTHDKPFRTNSQGIRAQEITRARPRGAKRLLALGDSQTAGDGLVLTDTWPAQLADKLSTADASADWEVLNAGLSGAAPWQYAILLERLTDTYEIDGVIIALYVNDVTPRPNVPLVEVTTNTWLHRVVYTLKRSALFTAIWRSRRSIGSMLWPDVNTGRETRIITGEDDPLLEQGWRDVEIGLRDMRDLTRDRGLELWVLVLPRRDQVDGSQTGRAYNLRSAKICRDLGIHAVDVLDPLMRAYADHGRKLFIAWDGHNSALANEVIARELAAVVLAH